MADPVALHVRLFLGGMAPLAVSGYVLTALPGWTETPRFGARASAGLALLGLAGLAGLVAPGTVPMAPALLPAVVTLTATIRFLKTRPGPRALILLLLFPLCGALALLGDGMPDTVPRPADILVLLLAGLITLVGGRALPAFAAFWTEPQSPGQRGKPGVLAKTSIPALIFTGMAIAAALSGWQGTQGMLLILAAPAVLLPLRGWPWRIALGYPALLILSLSFLWLPLGLALLGFSLVFPDAGPTPADALHALTAGALCSMIHGFMARPAMRREKGRLRLGLRLGAGHGLIMLGGALRLAATIPAPQAAPLLAASALAMALGFLFFLSAYLPSLARPAPRPVFSAAHARNADAPQEAARPLTR